MIEENNSGRKDVYNDEKKYRSWKEYSKENGIQDVSKKSSDLIINYITDMEMGNNITKGTKKGGRSFIRLNSIRLRIIFVTKLLEKRGVKCLSEVKESDIKSLFHAMRTGDIRKLDGGIYKSVADYVKIFNAFWSWYIRINKKKGIAVASITEELDTSRDENSFVYLTKEDLDKIMPYFKENAQARLLFMFDTIIRSPTELMSVKVSDLRDNCKELCIRDETSKTFGRTIKILLCSDALKEYIKRKELKDNDFLFDFSPSMFNRKLKEVGKEVFGDKISKGGKKYSELTMYDLRHSGSCYWRTGAYKSKIDALMYRGGWNNLAILNYYTKKIGMKDTIERDDLLIETDKHELEKKIERMEKERINETSKLRKEMREQTAEYLKDILGDLKEYGVKIHKGKVIKV
jgi:hypothetical protein